MKAMEISRVMSHLAKLSNRNITDAQREARRLNAEKAREALKAKRDNEAVFTVPSEWPEHSPQ